MGLDIRTDRFSAADYHAFERRLEACLQALSQVVEGPGFGAGDASIGAELEMALIDSDARPAPCNLALIEGMNEPGFTAEIDRFNLEFNSAPVPLAGGGFSALRTQLLQALQCVRQAPGASGLRPLTVGILPSLRQSDLGVQAMTPLARYRALNRVIRQHRGSPFQIHINGLDPLRLAADDVTYEGANTSLQIHLKVPPADFVNHFNASQMALGPVLAAVGNSPVFLGHRLWEETRVVVFKQAVDDRNLRACSSRVRPRVGLGRDWWRGGLAESFAQHLRSYQVLLPICSEQDLDAQLAAGQTPSLAELCTHNGTIWHWNRPVYESAGAGHMRIEFRVLPSGPTTLDMMANAAWMLGLSMGLASQGTVADRMPFAKAEFNLYRAAQSGLAAHLLWPGQVGLERVAAHELVLDLLPLAEQGLRQWGVAADEVRTCLGVIRDRVRSGQTGSRWQHDYLMREGVYRGRDETLHRMVNRYESLSRSEQPVHLWPAT